jgi:Initiator Replication protein
MKNASKPKTLQLLADRRKELDTLVAAGEVIDMRYDNGKTGMSLRSSKLLHFLVASAGADAGKAKQHSIRIADLNEFHVSKEDFLQCARELFRVEVRMEIVRDNGKRATKMGALLADVELDEDDTGELRYELSPVLREVMRASNHWAILSQRAVMAFKSKYSLRLYELVSLRIGLKHMHSESFTIDHLRKLFGVPKGKLKTWQTLKQSVLEPAVAEVNRLCGLNVAYTPIKRGRSVTGIQLTWRVKEQAARDAAAAELDRSSVGLAARRDNKVETVVDDGDDRYVSAAEFAALGRRLGDALRVNKTR